MYYKKYLTLFLNTKYVFFVECDKMITRKNFHMRKFFNQKLHFTFIEIDFCHYCQDCQDLTSHFSIYFLSIIRFIF